MKIRLQHLPNISTEEFERLQRESPVYELLKWNAKAPRNKSGVEAFVEEQEYSDWTRQLTNRLGELRITHIFTISYFQKGIPDDEWYISPGRNGNTCDYFPHFEEEHYSIHYFFNYFANIFYNKYFTVLDVLLHVLNIYYDLKVRQDLGFKKSVMDGLREKNGALHKYLDQVRCNSIYEEAEKYRNDLIHNSSPFELGSQITKIKGNNGGETIGIGSPKYVESKKIKSNMEASLVLLSEVLKRTDELCTAHLEL